MSDERQIPACDTHIFAPKLRAYCVIVGVYNEGERIRRQLTQMQPYRDVADIIVVDGGSDDGGTAIDFVRDKVRAMLIKTEAGGGLSAQHRAAFSFALDEGYTGIIVMDGNGKDGVDAIPKFIEALRAGYDMVQGSRFMPGGGHLNTPMDRVLGIRLVFSPLMSLGARFRYTDAINGFKAHSRRYLLDPRVQPFRNVFTGYSLQYYLTWRAGGLGFRITEVPVRRFYPASGPTPTKIRGLQGRLSILRQLFATLAGKYNPAG